MRKIQVYIQVERFLPLLEAKFEVYLKSSPHKTESRYNFEPQAL